MTPRKHADLIKAWADGAEIQIRCRFSGDWLNIDVPIWSVDCEYRLKPVPKADYRKMGIVHLPSCAIPVNVTFDGETGEAKKVEIVK
jgi:hypothetical protein